MHPSRGPRHSSSSLSARTAPSSAAPGLLRPAGRPRPRTTLDVLGSSASAAAAAPLMAPGIHTLPVAPVPSSLANGRGSHAAASSSSSSSSGPIHGGARPVWSYTGGGPTSSPPLPAVPTRFAVKDLTPIGAASAAYG